MKRLRSGATLVMSAMKGLMAHHGTRSAAALSFYALFSIAPIIYLAANVAGMLASDVNFQQQVTKQFAQLLGPQAATGIDVLLSTLESQSQSQFQVVIGVVVLIFSATNMFVQFQLTFNEIFGVQAQARTGFLKQIFDRVVSLGLVLSLGFLLIVSLVLDSLVLLFNEYLVSLFSDAAVVIAQASQLGALAVLVSSVIYGMFHFLPDVYLPNYLKLRASLLVAATLLVGKYGMGAYIANSRVSELGGASASVFVLMLWIYFSSLILCFAAEVIRVLAENDGVELQPRRYATVIRAAIGRNESSVA